MWAASRLYRWLGILVVSELIPGCDWVCVTTGTRRLDRLGQLAEVEQESITDSQQGSNTDSHSERSKAQVAPPGEKAPPRSDGVCVGGL